MDAKPETLREKVKHTVVKSNLLDYDWEWEELTDALMPVIEDHLAAKAEETVWQRAKRRWLELVDAWRGN